jgi:hypothetical protein
VVVKHFYAGASAYKWYGREPDLRKFPLWGNFAQVV